MKIKVEKGFSAGGEDYEKGETYDVKDSIAKSVAEKGYAEIVDEDDEDDGPVVEPKDDEIEVNPKSDEEEKPEVNVRGADKEEVINQMRANMGKPAAETWNPQQDTDKDPEDHPVVVGEVINKGVNPEHDTEFVHVEDEDSGQVKSIFAHKVLKDVIGKAEIGDFMAVRWTGRGEGEESGQSYLTYRYELRDENGTIKANG